MRHFNYNIKFKYRSFHVNQQLTLINDIVLHRLLIIDRWKKVKKKTNVK